MSTGVMNQSTRYHLLLIEGVSEVIKWHKTSLIKCTYSANGISSSSKLSIIRILENVDKVKHKCQHNMNR